MRCANCLIWLLFFSLSTWLGSNLYTLTFYVLKTTWSSLDIWKIWFWLHSIKHRSYSCIKEAKSISACLNWSFILVSISKDLNVWSCIQNVKGIKFKINTIYKTHQRSSFLNPQHLLADIMRDKKMFVDSIFIIKRIPPPPKKNNKLKKERNK